MSSNPLATYLLPFKGPMADTLSEVSGFGNWKFFLEDKKLLEKFEEEKDKIIYLSPDSPNILENVEDDKIYVIGKKKFFLF